MTSEDKYRLAVEEIRDMVSTYLKITPGWGPGHALARDVLAQIDHVMATLAPAGEGE